jgi:hypothetical protein
MYLSQSTAVTIDIGPFKGLLTNETDDGIDVTTIQVSLFQLGTKTDLTITASGGNNDMVSHGFAGIYSLELTASNVGTVGPLSVVAIVGDFQVVRHDFFIVDQPAYEEITLGGTAENTWRNNFSPMVATPSIDSSTNNTLVLDVDPGDYPDDYFNNMVLMVWVSGDPYKQARIATDYDSATTTITINEDWDINPDSTYTLTVWPFEMAGGASGTVDANLVSVNGTTETADVIEELFATDADTVKNSFADALLKRDWVAVAGEAQRSLLNAVRFLRNRRRIVAGVLNVTEEDDTTVAWTANLTTDANAEPITDIDPT